MPSLTTTQSNQAMANRSPAAKRRATSPVCRRDGSTPSSPVQTSSKASRSSQAGGFGLFLLLLAAMPFGDEHNGGEGALDSGDCPKGSRPSLASTSNLRYAASFEDMMRAGSRLLDFDDFDDDNENDDDDAEGDLTDDERRRRRKLRQMQKRQKMLVRTGPNSVFGSLTQGFGGQEKFVSSESEGMYREDTDGSAVLSQYTDEVSSNSFCSTSAADLLNHPIHTLSDLSRECLSMAMGFLPLKDVNRCRSVSSSFNWAALTDVPSPLPGSLFMRFENTHRGKSFATPPSRQLLKWICNFCNTQNNVNFNTCRSCGGGNADCLGVRKVFLGQLRKERTTELVDWILSRIFPEMKPLHIENHTGKDNRGKGCAWVYVTSAEDEAKLLSLNKRMFVDVDDDGKEGVWFCENSYAKELNTMATDRAYKPKRPIVLPRQPLTAEKPGAKPSPPSKGHNSSPTSGYSTHWTKSGANTDNADVKEQPSPNASAQELYEKYASESAATPQPASKTSNQQANKKFASHSSAATPAPARQQQRQMRQQQSQQQQQAQFHYKPNTINVYDYPYTAEEMYNAQYGGGPSSSSTTDGAHYVYGHHEQPQQQQNGGGQQHYSHNPYSFTPVQMTSALEEEEEFADAATYQFVDVNRMPNHQAANHYHHYRNYQQQQQQYNYHYPMDGEMM